MNPESFFLTGIILVLQRRNFRRSNATMWALYKVHVGMYKGTITDLPKVTRGANAVAGMRHRVSWLWFP